MTPVAGELELTIHYQQTEDGYVAARIAEVPAAISFGRTRDEARESVLDGLRELALSYLEQPPSSDEHDAQSEAIRIHAALA